MRKGFRAQWEVSSLATSAQAQYLGNEGPVDACCSWRRCAARTRRCRASTRSGVSLVDPVNVYSQADRASKYGLLFVLLTFVGFFMFELIKQLPIHPIQYGLVGLALAIFFLLLVSLSEHIAVRLGVPGRERRLHRPARVLPERGVAQRARAAGLRGDAGDAVRARCTACWCRRTTRWCSVPGCCSSILAAIMVVTRKVDWYAAGARALSHG